MFYISDDITHIRFAGLICIWTDPNEMHTHVLGMADRLKQP